MRQARVLLIGLLVAIGLATTLYAQNYVWSAINGVPVAPGLILTGQLLVPDGTSTNASIEPQNNPGGLGIYFSNSLIQFAASNVRVAYFGSSEIAFQRSVVVDGGSMRAYLSVEAVTTTKSPGTDEGLEVYTNEGDSDGAIITLPSAATGMTYTICVQTGQTLTITAAAGDTIRMGSTATAAAGSISSNVVGSIVTLTAINATEWVATSIVGSWSM